MKRMIVALITIISGTVMVRLARNKMRERHFILLKKP